MTDKYSYTADVTSEIGQRFKAALDKAGKSVSPRRAKELQHLQHRFSDLRSRGLIKKQHYASTSTGEFERKYYKMEWKKR